MKGILFNEKFGLESATLNGSKTRTSRDELKDAVEIMGWLRQGLKIGEHPNTILYVDKDGNRPLHKCKYKIGDIVAIKQSYKDAGFAPDKILYKSNFFDSWEERFDKQTGWGNKMFVCASLMPHQIQITDIKFERLQDISNEDCLKEGIEEHMKDVQYGYPSKIGYCGQYPFDTPRKAFAALIDKISGKGTWEHNEYHVVYYYELTTF